ncbi:unnamed protein product [Mytilus edulis]|uniref:Uncharacterized protein n=1 Tax=Mytilus edulis TaxID=6550 RepID=A0A8S3SL15_MYTED|nr:unnamed protein product [Mytilus edulis]
MVHRFPEPIRKHVVEVLKTGQVCKELINYDNILLYLEVSCISRPLKTACEEKLLECVEVMNSIDALQIAEKNLFKSHDVNDRFSVACAQKDETEAPYVYIASGKRVVRYDPILLKHEHCHNLNHQRLECSLVVLGDFIYALGGHHNGNNVLEIE